MKLAMLMKLKLKILLGMLTTASVNLQVHLVDSSSGKVTQNLQQSLSIMRVASRSHFCIKEMSHVTSEVCHGYLHVDTLIVILCHTLL